MNVKKICSNRYKPDREDCWENECCVSCLETDEDLAKCQKCNLYCLYSDYDAYYCSGCNQLFCWCEPAHKNPRHDRYITEKYCGDCYPEFDNRPYCCQCEKTKDDLSCGYLYECDICKETYCNHCSMIHTRKSTQPRNGWEILNTYCNQCNVLLDSPQDKARRRLELVQALREYHLELRSDSKLCTNCIDGDLEGWTLPQIVRKMCKMKYLYEYCNFEEYLSQAHDDQQDELDAGYYPDMTAFEQAEDNAWRHHPCPTVFPWMLGSPIDPNKKETKI